MPDPVNDIDPYPQISGAIRRQMRVSHRIWDDCLMEAWVVLLADYENYSRNNWRRALRSAIRTVRKETQ